LEDEKYEKIKVNELRDGRRGSLINDLYYNKNGIIDMDGNRCFVMNINSKNVINKRYLFEIIRKM
jgi:integral membrane protein 2B